MKIAFDEKKREGKEAMNNLSNDYISGYFLGNWNGEFCCSAKDFIKLPYLKLPPQLLFDTLPATKAFIITE